MSVMNREGVKIVLERADPDDFWRNVLRHYARRHPERWRALAMLALRVNNGWPLECIARTFGLERSNVARTLRRVSRDLRQRFDLPERRAPRRVDPRHEADWDVQEFNERGHAARNRRRRHADQDWKAADHRAARQAADAD